MVNAIGETTAQAPDIAPKGLGGWMILPVIGTCLAPWLPLWQAIQSISLVSNPNLAADLRNFILMEVIGNVLISLIWLVAIILLFAKKRSYPRVFIAGQAAFLVLIASDLLVAHFGFDLAPDPSDIKSLARAVIGSAIWIPYMLVSKRVANTFVN